MAWIGGGQSCTVAARTPLWGGLVVEMDDALETVPFLKERLLHHSSGNTFPQRITIGTPDVCCDGVMSSRTAFICQTRPTGGVGYWGSRYREKNRETRGNMSARVAKRRTIDA